MKEHDIGQILFVLLKGETNIHPVLVVEELRKKTLQGESIDYTVEVAAKGGKKSRVNLHELEATVFVDVEEARDFLVSNATKAIGDICERAKVAAARLFGEEQPTPATKDERQTAPTSPSTVVLENGVKGRVIIPQELLG